MLGKINLGADPYAGYKNERRLPHVEFVNWVSRDPVPKFTISLRQWRPWRLQWLNAAAALASAALPISAQISERIHMRDEAAKALLTVYVIADQFCLACMCTCVVCRAQVHGVRILLWSMLGGELENFDATQEYLVQEATLSRLSALQPLILALAVFVGATLVMIKFSLPKLTFGQMFSVCPCSPVYLLRFKPIQLRRDQGILRRMIIYRGVLLWLLVELVWYDVQSHDIELWDALVFNYDDPAPRGRLRRFLILSFLVTQLLASMLFMALRSLLPPEPEDSDEDQDQTKKVQNYGAAATESPAKVPNPSDLGPTPTQGGSSSYDLEEQRISEPQLKERVPSLNKD